MDFPRKYVPNVATLLRPAQRVRRLLDRTPEAEARLQQFAAKIAPVWKAVYRARRRIATAAVVTVTLSIFIHVMFGANGMVVYRQKKSEYQQLQSQIDHLQKENDASTSRVRSLQNDPQAIEKEAREQLHYTRPGEVIYVSPAPAQPIQQDHRSASKNK